MTTSHHPLSVSKNAATALPSLAEVPVRKIAQPSWIAELLHCFPETTPRDRFFSIGIDAGTSGIRIAIHDEFQARTTLFDFGRNYAGGTRFSFPAIIGCAGESLVFGNEVVSLAPDDRFVSFKGALIHPEAEQHLCSRWARMGLPYAAPLCRVARPSVADFLYTVSVARALELALPTLISNADAPVYVTFTIGAPLNSDLRFKQRFNHCLGAAVRLVGSVGSEARTATLVEYFAGAWMASSTAPDRQNQRLSVRSEAHSAILPLRRIFDLGRNFLVADVGATTTDIAVVRIGASQRPWCYSSQSAAIGVDTLDSSEIALDNVSGDILSLRIERTKRSSSEATTGVRRKAAEPLGDVLSSVLHSAMDKNPDPGSWSTLYVVAVGGGSRIPELQQLILGSQARGWVENRQRPGLVLDQPLVVGSSSLPPSPDEEYELVSVLGSAVPEWEAGHYSTADQVSHVIPTYARFDDYHMRPVRSWL